MFCKFRISPPVAAWVSSQAVLLIATILPQRTVLDGVRGCGCPPTRGGPFWELFGQLPFMFHEAAAAGELRNLLGFYRRDLQWVSIFLALAVVVGLIAYQISAAWVNRVTRQ